jgi:hypothetical protein
VHWRAMHLQLPSQGVGMVSSLLSLAVTWAPHPGAGANVGAGHSASEIVVMAWELNNNPSKIYPDDWMGLNSCSMT